jgi:TonB-dependent starch-binding outer membrane protein SusC
MKTIGRTLAAVGGALVLVTACGGGPGLPPAGPQPGEVDVGYGTQPAEKVTGAVSTVTPDGSASGSLNLEQLLRGKAAGLQFYRRADGSQGVRIRGGNTSLLGAADSEPLIVLDGVPVAQSDLAGALASLTRADIRQVDVLRDAASTSVYGLRGASGVIVITTNRR